MKVLVVGATGLIGGAVAEALAGSHEVLRASRSSATLPVDITDSESVARLFARTGKLDAIVVAAGHAPFGRFDRLALDDYGSGLRSKLLGQVDIVRQGSGHLADHGSLTLTSGILSTEPLRGASASAAANGGLEAFVRTSATELPRGQRINIVKPTIVAGSPQVALDRFEGFEPVPLAQVVNAYIRSIEGVRSGHVYEVL
ncbi:MAG: short chain dehydrogenase [Nostocoides sp.]